MDHRDKQQWDKVAEIDWALRKLNLQVEVLDENSVAPILKEVAEFEIDIAGLESIKVANDNPEQSNAIKERIFRSKEKIQELVGIQESYSKFYKEKIGIEIGNTSNAFKTQLESALIQIENNPYFPVSILQSGYQFQYISNFLFLLFHVISAHDLLLHLWKTLSLLFLCGSHFQIY